MGFPGRACVTVLLSRFNISIRLQQQYGDLDSTAHKTLDPESVPDARWIRQRSQWCQKRTRVFWLHHINIYKPPLDVCSPQQGLSILIEAPLFQFGWITETCFLIQARQDFRFRSILQKSTQRVNLRTVRICDGVACILMIYTSHSTTGNLISTVRGRIQPRWDRPCSGQHLRPCRLMQWPIAM